MPHARQLAQLVDDVLGRADQRIAAPAGLDANLICSQRCGGRRCICWPWMRTRCLDRRVVALLDDVIVRDSPRPRCCVSRCNDMAVAPDLKLAADIPRAPRRRSAAICALIFVEICSDRCDEGHVGIFRGEMRPLARAAGIHQRRKRLLHRLRHGESLSGCGGTCPRNRTPPRRVHSSLHDLDPFGRIVVARVVLHDLARRTFRARARTSRRRC